MRTYIIGNDLIALCRDAPAIVSEGEIVVASKEELQAAPLSAAGRERSPLGRVAQNQAPERDIFVDLEEIDRGCDMMAILSTLLPPGSRAGAVDVLLSFHRSGRGLNPSLAFARDSRETPVEVCVSLKRPGEPVGSASPTRQPDSNDNRLFLDGKDSRFGFLGACREISDGLTLLPLRDSVLVDPVALSEGFMGLVIVRVCLTLHLRRTEC